MIIKERIMEALKELCVPAHVKGYKYLVYAIELCIEDNSILEHMTKELYPYVAEMFGGTVTSVERAIRYAVDISYAKSSMDTLEKYFGKSNVRVSNSEFIATLVFRLQL